MPEIGRSENISGGALRFIDHVVYTENLLRGREWAPVPFHQDHELIDISTPGFSILTYFGEMNSLEPIDPNSNKPNIHNAIDITAPPGTSVWAPEDAYVVDMTDYGLKNTSDFSDVSHMCNIALVTKERRILYHLAHIDRASVPKSMLWDYQNPKMPEVKRGQLIGAIATWHYDAKAGEHGAIIDEKVREYYHQRGLNFGSHLHIATAQVPVEADLEDIHYKYQGDGKEIERKYSFNPLLILPKL